MLIQVLELLKCQYLQSIGHITDTSPIFVRMSDHNNFVPQFD